HYGSPYQGLFVISVADESDFAKALHRTLKSRPGVAFINLRGATEEVIREFLMKPEVVQRFIESSGGVPENLPDLLEIIPAKVEHLYLRRFERLDDEEQRLLGVLAAFGKPVSPELLLRVVDKPPSSMLSGLFDRRMVTKRVHRGQLMVDFPTEDNRQLVYARVDEKVRRSLHGRIAALFEERMSYGEQTDVVELARHYLRSDDKSRAAEYCLLAAERLHISFAYEQAIELLDRAFPHIQGAEERCEVLERLIDLRACQSEHKKALYYCGLLKKETPEEQRGPLYRRVSEMLLELGAYRTASKLLEQAKELLEALPESQDRLDELVRVEAVNAEALYGRGKYDQVLEVCARALKKIASSPAADAQRQVLRLTNTMGKVHLFQEDFDRATEAFRSNLRRAEQNHWSTEMVRARFNLGAIALRQRDYSEAEEIFQECLLQGPGSQNPITKAFCLMNLGVLYHKTHRYENALDSYLHGLATFKKSGNDLQFAVVALNLGDLYLTIGDLIRARALVENSLALSQANDLGFFKGWASHVMSGIARGERRYAEAEKFAGEAETVLERLGSLTWLRRARVQRAQLAYDQGQLDRCQSILDAIPLEPKETESGQEAKDIEGQTRLLRGQIHTRRGHLAEARPELESARDLFRAVGSLEGLWEVELRLAELSIAGGNKEVAGTHLKEGKKQVSALAKQVPDALRETYMASRG
ncbi:MAG: tetratricopeptide repeat protein, partial [Myxococcales bacterium]|nr:tetratricopeptide repeat protein [Myxococcales bacterium]